MQPLLSVCIPTVVGREHYLERMMTFLKDALPKWGEVIIEKDDKSMTLGAKRNLLLSKANGKYVVMFDDDDALPPNYFQLIEEGLKSNADCVGYLETCFMDGQFKQSIFSLSFKRWQSNVAGYDYVRTPFYKCPIKTSIARQAGFDNTLRVFEDEDFAKRIRPLLKTMFYIEVPCYYYMPDFAEQNGPRYG